jgi:hypothetical protein
MMEALVAAAASALVGAMTTDAWGAAKEGFARVFTRGGKRQAELAEMRLTAAERQLEQAAADDRSRLREELAAAWQVRLRDLLEESPDAADELQAITDKVRAQLPTQQQIWVQQNVARDQSVLFANQGGNQQVHYHNGPTAPDGKASHEADGDPQ